MSKAVLDLNVKGFSALLCRHLTVSKDLEFCYGHQLPQYKGKCCNQHGHNAKLRVTFDDNHDRQEYPGMVLDFHLIKAYVGPIVEDLDHKELTSFCDPETCAPVFGTGRPPTAENILLYIVYRIFRTPIGTALVKAALWESNSSFTEWARPE